MGNVTCDDLAHIEVSAVSFGWMTVAKNWLVTPANWIGVLVGLPAIDFADENQPPLKLDPSVKWIVSLSRQK